MTQDVFIVGSKGIPAAYGGFETFVERLTKNRINDGIRYHVACMDKQAMETEHNDAHCFHVKVPAIGPAKAVYYDLAALFYVLSYIQKNKIEHPIVYVLACRVGPFVGYFKKKIHAMGGKLYVNPDGHEWKRAKWSRPIRRYWKFSEKGMVKHADLLICDSKSIEAYIRKDYRKLHPRTTYIAYGADVKNTEILTRTTTQEKYNDFLQKHDLWENGYYLVVGRMVPENNYETMVREFMQTKTEKSFVLVTDIEGNKFYEELKKRLGFDADPRVKFVGTVYDDELLSAIRAGAYAYLHGHEVGGTNPSLLEALGATTLNLLLNVGFNKEVAEDAALYWDKSDGDLCALIGKAEEFSQTDRAAFGPLAKKRIEEAFSWHGIVEQYEELFLPTDDPTKKRCSVCRPTVSVAMASYNGEKYIEEQIASILPQLHEMDELLISDDGSTDRTIEIIYALMEKDARIRLIKGPGKGVKQNFACLLEHASVGQPDHSGILFLADQDDVWEPNKVERMLETFAQTDADVVVHDVRVVNAQLDETIMESFFAYRGSGAGALKNIKKNTYMGSAMAIRESVIADSLPIPDNIEMHDWWIGVRNDLHGKGTVFLPEILGKYRRHESAVTDFGHNSIPVMIKNRLRFVKMLRKY